MAEEEQQEEQENKRIRPRERALGQKFELTSFFIGDTFSNQIELVPTFLKMGRK